MENMLTREVHRHETKCESERKVSVLPGSHILMDSPHYRKNERRIEDAWQGHALILPHVCVLGAGRHHSIRENQAGNHDVRRRPHSGGEAVREAVIEQDAECNRAGAIP